MSRFKNAETEAMLLEAVRRSACRHNITDFRDAVFMSAGEVAECMGLDIPAARLVRWELRRLVREWWDFEDSAYGRERGKDCNA